MMSSEVYNLTWNDYQSTLSSSVGTLLDDSDFIDVTLACEGQSFSAHKVVLSSCSVYLKKLLKRNPCQHPIVILKDVRANILHFLVHFMYHGAVDVPEEQLSDFLNAAQALEIKGLAKDEVQKQQESKPSREDFGPPAKRARIVNVGSSRSRNPSVISVERARSLVSSGYQAERRSEVSISVSEHSNSNDQTQDDVKVKQEDSGSDLEIVEQEQQFITESDADNAMMAEEDYSTDPTQQYSSLDYQGEESAGPSQGMMESSQGRKIVCEICGKDFFSRSNLQRHIEGVHIIKPKQEMCTICFKLYKTKPYLETHLRNVHGIKKKT